MFSMNDRLPKFGFLALTAGFSMLTSLAFADKHVAAGRYRWVPSADETTFFKRHHLTVPTASMMLSADGVFRYTATDDQGSETTLGTFTIDGDKLIFAVETGEGVGLPRKMKFEGDGLAATGVHFVREKAVVLEEKAPKAPDPTPIVRHTEIEGAWTVRTAKGENRGQRFTFLGDGHFRYSGDGATCAGHYVVVEDGIELVYEEEDGKALDSTSAPLHKHLPLIEGHLAFMVDTYRYERASD